MAEQVGSSVVGKVVDLLFGVAKKEIGYMWNCKENVEKFKNEVESLKVTKRQVQQQIDIANSKGDNLLSGVEEWLNKAGDAISKAEVFLEKEANAKKTCFKIGMCGNWATLYRYGKGATEMTPSLLEHKASGTHFVPCTVAVETLPPTQLDVYQTKNPEDLVTHNSALNAIIAALQDESKQIIGIYGLGGVGKTTLAKEVVAKVKHLFADVAFTTVSETVNAEKIQKDLENATKRIKKGDKILIILDDVWEKLNLKELRIPCGSNYKNCKILLTSRSARVCHEMNAQSKICVNSLPTEDETDSNLKPVASKVVEKLVDSLFDAAKKKIGYMWNCKENVEKFKNEVEKLKDMKGRVQQQIGIAKLKGDNLLSGVEEWLNKAGDEISKADEFHGTKTPLIRINVN